jgi:hypothetical protein
MTTPPNMEYDDHWFIRHKNGAGLCGTSDQCRRRGASAGDSESRAIAEPCRERSQQALFHFATGRWPEAASFTEHRREPIVSQIRKNFPVSPR